jgi:peptidoglycan/xylan/chitin deacetylase (PgdA/CDA1 family)
VKVVSLIYHDIITTGRPDESGFPGSDAAVYKLDREMFARHMEAISEETREQPARIWDLNQHNNTSTPFLLTFDDGGVSAYTCSAKLLEERGWHGHFFVTTDYIDKASFLTGDQIRDLHARGHVIGSHSCSHPTRMSRCSWSELLAEWRNSIELLSDLLNQRVVVASVPGGYFSRRVAEAAAKAGIKTLFTSEPVIKTFSVGECLVLGRYSVQRWTTPSVAAKIAAGKLSPRLQQNMLWNMKKIGKRFGGSYYLKARRALFSKN